MKVNLKSFLSGLIFILSELIVLAYFNQYWIRCKPCLPEQDCPICLSPQQEYAIWTSGIIAFVYLVFVGYRFIQKNQKFSSE